MATDAGEILEQVRHSVMRMLAALPLPPHALRVRAGDVSVEVEWNGAAAGAGPVLAGDLDGMVGRSHICAPTVGVFYRAPEPGAPPFVAEGDIVSVGQRVAIVEAMKLMIPVEAGRPGRIAEVLKENGDPVEYDEPLFAIDPADVD